MRWSSTIYGSLKYHLVFMMQMTKKASLHLKMRNLHFLENGKHANFYLTTTSLKCLNNPLLSNVCMSHCLPASSLTHPCSFSTAFQWLMVVISMRKAKPNWVWKEQTIAFQEPCRLFIPYRKNFAQLHVHLLVKWFVLMAVMKYPEGSDTSPLMMKRQQIFC